LKQWGRQKIRYELRLKKISAACIEQALAGIETEEYEKVLNALVRKKWDALTATEGKSALLKSKLLLYLSQKGYEAEEVRQALKKIEGPE
jgi:regulatory protein